MTLSRSRLQELFAASVSWDLRARAPSYADAVFLVSGQAVNHLAATKGWKFGVGPRTARPTR